jgi:hypothetical protein
MKLDTLFRQIEQMPQIQRAEGDYIPMPSTPEHPGILYLFINCTYKNRPENEQPAELLAQLRSDAVTILIIIASLLSGADLQSVCLSFFLIPMEGQNIRIYRTAVARSNLANVKTQGLAACDGEESHHPELRRLITGAN